MTMQSLHPESNGQSNAPQVRYERSDAHIRAIGAIACGLVVIIVIMNVVAGWLFRYFGKVAARRPVTFPLAVQEAEKPLEQRLRQQLSPGQPLLEGLVAPQGPMDFYRPLQASHGTQPLEQGAYGPALPPERGYVRIPIEQAMKMLVNKKLLPSRADNGVKMSALGQPSQANSGRGPRRGEQP